LKINLPINIDSKYTVLITTSGVGSRLGNYTLFTNKSLIVLGKKPALSYIIEKYPKDTMFVITLGYFGDHVKEFLELTYPERNFTFVEVDPFSGPNSSLGFSIFCAKDFLQKPFVYHACDTLILDTNIPEVDSDWVAGFSGKDATNYASFDAKGEVIEKFNAKGMTDFDFIHIGLAGIYSYKEFWSELESLLESEANNTNLSDVSVLENLTKNNVRFRVEEINDWIDIGNSNSLVNAKKMLSGTHNVLEKPQESISFIKNFVVKFFSDHEVVANRVDRIKYLGDTVPPLRNSSKHFYSYEFHNGETLANSVDPGQMFSLLEWMKLNLWSYIPSDNKTNFSTPIEDFYLKKSINRLNEFLESRLVNDENCNINGQITPPAKELITRAMPVLLGDTQIGRFHGDLILDNVLVSSGSFKLIDWRQDFGGNLEFGDIYYDLAKLNHSCHINHEIVVKGDFFVRISDSQIQCGILRKDVHVEMEHNLFDFARAEDLNLNKIKVLTSLIWLNMAPLHHHPFDKFLYYYGRYNLWRSLSAKA
jgi:choline kinase